MKHQSIQRGTIALFTTAGVLAALPGNAAPSFGEIKPISITDPENAQIGDIHALTAGNQYALAASGNSVYAFDVATGSQTSVFTFDLNLGDSSKHLATKDNMAFIGQPRSKKVEMYNIETNDLVRTFNTKQTAESNFFGECVTISGNSVFIQSRTTQPNSVVMHMVVEEFDLNSGTLLQTYSQPTTPNLQYLFSNANTNSLAIRSSTDDGNYPRTPTVTLINKTQSDARTTYMPPEGHTPSETQAYGRSLAMNENLLAIGGLRETITDEKQSVISGRHIVDIYNTETGDHVGQVETPNWTRTAFSFEETLPIDIDNDMLLVAGRNRPSLENSDSNTIELFDLVTLESMGTIHQPSSLSEDFGLEFATLFDASNGNLWVVNETFFYENRLMLIHVPEPASLGLLALGGLLVAQRRRHP